MLLRSIGPTRSITETVTLPRSRQAETSPLQAVCTLRAASSRVMPQVQALSISTGASNNRVLRMDGSAAVGLKKEGVWVVADTGPILTRGRQRVPQRIQNADRLAEW